jgi:MFS superfamily sulfate permease-like transporter
VKAVVLDMESTNIIDLEGSDELQAVAKELAEQGIAFYVARVKVKIMQILEKDGAFETVPRERFYRTVDQAMAAAMQASQEPGKR